PEYRELHNEIKRISHRLKKLEGEEKAKVLLEYQEKRKRLTTLPCTSQTNKVLKVVRYADDFIISVKGSKEDCRWIKEQLKLFIHNKLKMELSEEKTLITHSSQAARFLGYDIRVRRSGTIKRSGKVKKRTLNGSVELLIPLQDKIR
ncbi:reverse transcriptase domain-containing protein, partial [Lactococcus lactis]